MSSYRPMLAAWESMCMRPLLLHQAWRSGLPADVPRLTAAAAAA
jgi:hypothetical protein